MEETQTTSATFQINNAKIYVPVVTLSINHNIKFLENTKQGFKRTISWNKYRSEITTQPKNNNLIIWLIEHLGTLIDCLLTIGRLLSFKNGDNHPTRGSYDKYYIQLVEIKDFSTLIDNKPFLTSQ